MDVVFRIRNDLKGNASNVGAIEVDGARALSRHAKKVDLDCQSAQPDYPNAQ